MIYTLNSVKIEHWKYYMILTGDTTVIKVLNMSKTKETLPVSDNKPAHVKLSIYSDANTEIVFNAKSLKKRAGKYIKQ